MKSHPFGVIWLGLLCSGLLPFVHGKEYIIDKETDGILLNCAIAFLVLCTVFLILAIITSLFVYRKVSKQEKFPHKGYNVSYLEREPKELTISSPFYGHGIYSQRPESSIYLPGRQSSDPVKSAAYENTGVDLDNNVKRDSPPTEKGQKDVMVSEKTVTMKTTYDNPAFENPGYESFAKNDYETVDNHDYEMLDPQVITKPGSKEL